MKSFYRIAMIILGILILVVILLKLYFTPVTTEVSVQVGYLPGFLHFAEGAKSGYF